MSKPGPWHGTTVINPNSPLIIIHVNQPNIAWRREEEWDGVLQGVAPSPRSHVVAHRWQLREFLQKGPNRFKPLSETIGLHTIVSSTRHQDAYLAHFNPISQLPLQLQ
jgi:hypothetical protein